MTGIHNHPFDQESSCGPTGIASELRTSVSGCQYKLPRAPSEARWHTAERYSSARPSRDSLKTISPKTASLLRCGRRPIGGARRPLLVACQAQCSENDKSRTGQYIFDFERLDVPERRRSMIYRRLLDYWLAKFRETVRSELPYSIAAKGFPFRCHNCPNVSRPRR